MKRSKKMKTIFKRSLYLCIVTILLAGMLAAAVPSGSVSAATPSSNLSVSRTNDIPPQKANRIERAFKRTSKAVERQKSALEKVDKVVNRTEDFIQNMKDEGKDTTALSTALTAFKADVAEAGKVNQAALGILSKHDGFDADGKVTDVDKGRETIASARDQVIEFRAILSNAHHDIRNAIREYRKQNPPTKK
jgi:hypothetical protein